MCIPEADLYIPAACQSRAAVTHFAIILSRTGNPISSLGRAFANNPIFLRYFAFFWAGIYIGFVGWEFFRTGCALVVGVRFDVVDAAVLLKDCDASSACYYHFLPS